MKKKAFTLVEMMVVLILFTLLVTFLWKVYSQTQKTALEVVSDHAVNDELDRALTKITDDIREANSISSSTPPIYETGDLGNLKTEDENNELKFVKVTYDFTKDPSELADNEYNYTQIQIRYFVTKEDETNPNSKWLLNREMIPIDSNKQPDEANSTIYNILSGIDECIFYRIKDPDAVRSGNVYIRIKKGRSDGGKYTNEYVISVKERGAMPES